MPIKPLTLWRFTFYAGDFPLQRPMRSFKELHRLYLVICDLCEPFMRCAHRELPLVGGNMRLTPYLKLGGCAHGLLMMPHDFPQRPFCLGVHKSLHFWNNGDTYVLRLLGRWSCCSVSQHCLQV